MTKNHQQGRRHVSPDELVLREVLASHLQRLTRGRPVAVTPMDNQVFIHWTLRRSDVVEVSVGKRQHYLDGHPEMTNHHGDVINTLRDPDIVRSDRRRQDRALLYRRISGSQWILVVVEFGMRRRPTNLLVTAHLINERDVRNRDRSEPTVWMREE